MTQVFKETGLVICHKNLRNKFDKVINGKVPGQNYKSIIIYEFGTEELIIALKKLSTHYRSIKTLHRYFIFFSKNLPENDSVVAQFFDYVSERYDELIDSEQNISNIKYQLNYILQNVKIDKKSKILDFGCGTGVSALVKNQIITESSNFELLGYDISTQMIQKSKETGIKIITHKTIELLKDNSLDAIFASYSLHFLTDYKIIRLLWKKLKIGGLITANFHKSIGLEEISQLIKEENGTVEFLTEIGNSSIYCFRKHPSPLIDKIQISAFLKEHDVKIVNEFLIDTLIGLTILPEYSYNGSNFVLEGDLIKFLNFFKDVSFSDWIYGGIELYEKTFKLITSGLEINLRLEKKSGLSPFHIALLSNLMSNYNKIDQPSEVRQYDLDGICELQVKSTSLDRILQKHIALKDSIESSRASTFSNSASYMGTKKVLRTFLMEALQFYLSPDTTVLDLMCGSGAVSGALSAGNKTFVSDAMRFCRILAQIQGSGYTSIQADKLILEIQEKSKRNINELKLIFQEGLNREDILFHSEINGGFASDYAKYCKEYSFDDNSFKALYNEKIGKLNSFPYMLFSCGYSNLYFGLRQAIELDSYRFAIDQLESATDKIWAQGALIATVSALGNTYGGHFAQPKFKSLEALTLNKLFTLVEQRNISVSNEFAARLKAFAHESEKNSGYTIDEIEGPWPKALESFINIKGDKLIYLDAPYTRDEYSRYYHILETLIEYKYIDLLGIGRVPDKKAGFRFSSDFFTKSTNKLKDTYVNLILAILKHGISCAWSYSDSATISTAEIIYEIHKKTNCKIQSYATPYTFKAQGGRKSKKIKEYLIVFEPINN